MQSSNRLFSRLGVVGTLAAGCILATACGSTVAVDSTVPGPDKPLPTEVSITMDITNPDGTSNVTLNGVTYHDSPGLVRVPVGNQTISGSFTGSSLVLSFGGYVGLGGVPSGFVASVSGPSPIVSSCSITYNGSGGGVHTFSAAFSVSTITSGHC
ncbi:MAG TPA: hypothetical protein VD758_08580 [Gemmatimonadaceae bacterium]|nr:hypothetical protein [Gemmatimonadaceae bacterium]